MERVRREVCVGDAFDGAAFGHAFAAFRQLYNVAPERASCAPDVLARFCEVFATATVTHRHATNLRFEGVPLVAAILPPGTLAMEGDVDETQMGDW
ncbi:MAG: hypothetical protein NVS3B17_07880 [Vulcanimicrobiaceae bacterium]